MHIFCHVPLASVYIVVSLIPEMLRSLEVDYIAAILLPLSLIHIFLAHVRLYGVKDNQPRPILRDCLFYALVGEGKLPLSFINHKHAVKVGFGFY